MRFGNDEGDGRCFAGEGRAPYQNGDLRDTHVARNASRAGGDANSKTCARAARVGHGESVGVTSRRFSRHSKSRAVRPTLVTLFSEASTHNDAHTPPFVMSSHTAHTVMTLANDTIATGTTPASLADAQELIPGLPDHLVATHVLRSEVLRDPLLPARLRAVSHAMRSAVAATGREVKNPGNDADAAELGCLSTLKHRQSRGRLTRQEYLCQAAASGGHLEELKVLRENSCPWNVLTCLMAAATGGHLELVQWLRANGCPWHDEALYSAALKGHETVVRALIAGADINKSRDIGATPLYIAAQNGHEAVVRELIELGVDINKAMKDSSKPLYIAAQNGHKAVVRALIEASADIKKEYAHGGTTPLLIAAQLGHEAVVRELIKAGADNNKSRDIGATPLYITAQNGHEAVVRELIEASADVNKARDDGRTPLCIGAEKGHESVVRALIAAGADITKGATPLSIAKQKGHQAIVLALTEAGANDKI